MRLANHDGRATIVIEGRAVDVERASGGGLGSDPMLLSDLANHAVLRDLAAAAKPADWPALEEARIGPPVPRAGKGLGVALNYRKHAAETGRPAPDEPALFGKTDNCVCGPFDPILLPDGRDQVDYEAELVIVFGRTAKRVAAAEAWSYLAGVTVGQDISDRAEQNRPPVRQFTIAKSYDTFGPIGPCLVTVDELDEPDALSIECIVSGEVLQSSNTADLIFDVPALVEWVTRYLTFEPGDLLWTGTPEGVGAARSPQRFLRVGDVVETVIGGVGTMRNPIIAG
ncbi:MAG: fumarylacetoacetate hydrolase family protein [Ilumatobacteraceae bacterium]|nr:fumarylacetoacetate hydrolase family protein [Ilumatobacteraceae bacterium]